MNKLDTLILYSGATSEVEFDFSEFEFEENSKLLLTIKDISNNVVFQKNFSESKKYTVVFKDEFTATLNCSEYWYDIMYLINDERYPQCYPSRIIVNKVVGAYESSD